MPSPFASLITSRSSEASSTFSIIWEVDPYFGKFLTYPVLKFKQNLKDFKSKRAAITFLLPIWNDVTKTSISLEEIQLKQYLWKKTSIWPLQNSAIIKLSSMRCFNDMLGTKNEILIPTCVYITCKGKLLLTPYTLFL